MMTLEQIRERNQARRTPQPSRLQAAGYRLEGWDPRTGQRIAAQITGENTNDERRTFYSLSHLAGCRRRSSGLNAPDTLAGPHRKATPPHYPGSRREIIPNINPRTKEHTP